MFTVADRVQETATANTTVSFTLSGAIASYQSFAAIGNGNTTYYGATDGTNWEVGLGTYSTSPNTLTRTTILSSSNSGSAVTFSGTVTVWCDYPAGKQISSDYPNSLGVVVPASVKASSLSVPLSALTSSNTSTFQLGSNLSFSDTGITNNIVGSTNSYLQSALQNTNSGSSASAEYIVYNDQGTAATNFATVGINSSTYSGTGSINAAGYGYFLTGSTDLVLGTIGNNKIHFATNSQATDAVTIGTDNSLTVNGTITGQTEVLKGTGENLFTYSEQFETWAINNATITANSVNAPNGTLTADTLQETATTNYHAVNGNSTLPTNLTGNTTYTLSVYAKANTRTWLALNMYDTADRIAYFDLTNGVLGSVPTGGTATITSVGNGWYRCTLSRLQTVTPAFTNTLIAVSSGNNNWSYAGSVGQSIYIWGAQLELGATANTYIQTVSTAVYGTPTLSFSGVAGLGLQSDGSLYVSPAGTGAIQAQATTSSTVGGNARGANAVDWQTNRSNAIYVASGASSIVGGGYNNVANAQFAVDVGGAYNTASGYASFIGGGYSNQGASGNYSGILGGYGNNAAGYHNFIVGGYSNSGTSGSAVTTQSSTMNGTTAVTLGGSNASIKVGQLVTGTYISNFPNTYVAAVSGTSLTLSQNASGSGTATLSFYTPHGVVVGGGNNQATGSYSFIGGGGDAGTSSNRNVASGNWSAVVGGQKNTASGDGSFVGGGGYEGSTTAANTASGAGSVVVGGVNNVASAYLSSVLGGNFNKATGAYSATFAGVAGITRGILGYGVLNSSTAITFASGVSQAALLVLAKQTTDATATVLTSDGGAASTTNQIILPDNSAYYFQGEIVSGVTGGGNSKGWTISGLIKRGSGVASTTLVGSTVTSLYADVGASTWTIALAADTTNGGLKVTFTGQASTTIRTVCQIRTTEMTY